MDDKDNNIIDLNGFRKRTNEKRPQIDNGNHEPIINLPTVTKILIGIIVLAKISEIFMPSDMLAYLMFNLSFIPQTYMNGDKSLIFLILSPVTYTLIHGNWGHIAINSLMLAAFGSGVEKAIGAKKMIIAIIICAALGALLHFIFYFSSVNPVIGASGAISGLFALAIIYMRHFSVQIPVIPVALIWIGISVVFGLLGSTDGHSVAWLVHIGGFIGGFVCAYVFRHIK